MSNNPHQKQPTPEPVSRRALLETAGGVAAAGALAACGGKPQDICAVAMCTGPDMSMTDLVQAPACTLDSFTLPDADTLAVGQVRIISAEETALVRRADGFAIMSLRCRHAGCVTKYNTAAQTFDCPCHGSRFKMDGTVLQGPATDTLLYRSACRQNGLLTISRINYEKGTAIVK